MRQYVEVAHYRSHAVGPFPAKALRTQVGGGIYQQPGQQEGADVVADSLGRLLQRRAVIGG